MAMVDDGMMDDMAFVTHVGGERATVRASERVRETQGVHHGTHNFDGGGSEWVR